MSRQLQQIRSGQTHPPVAHYISPSTLTQLNPFVLWDHFMITNTIETAEFGFHGHSGVAAISYPLVGDIEHTDSSGHSGHLFAGGIQIMSAGKGVIHKEVVHPQQGHAEAFQLWTLLPQQSAEMGSVTYATAQKSALPVVTDSGSTTRVLIGEHQRQRSPIQHCIDMTYLHIAIDAGARWTHQSPELHATAFVFCRSGRLLVGDAQLKSGQLGVFRAGSEHIEIEATDVAAEFLLISGQPLTQPIISSGASIHSSQENLLAGTNEVQRLLQALRHNTPPTER
ncbi:pirin family protein [Ferrimonas kyonanensis]|uniref:pirin family protein n=1 Tax=Ferrimonas kyonanensis TaxID=364763 RepID=UPI00040D4E43|nr:pirin family protein [Ferrimonas kyonanensis]